MNYYKESCCPFMGGLHTNDVIVWHEERKCWEISVVVPAGGQLFLPVHYCPNCGTKQEPPEED